MAGHVFVTRSDLRRLALDAWLLPCGLDAQPRPMWVDGAWALSWPRPTSGWGRDHRTMRVDGMPPGRATPWLTHVGGGRSAGIDWFMKGVRSFLDAVAADLGGKSRHDRPRPIVGLPVVGTGAGGARGRAGEVIRAQLAEMYAGAERLDIDCVLVTYDGPTHAAAQAERRRWLRENEASGWPDLDAGLIAVAKGLSRKANRGQLVLFLGAGISAGAGLPLWGKLLNELAGRAGMGEEERKALRKLDVLDQAEIVEGRMGGSRELMTAAIQEVLSRHEYSLAHAMLAALPVSEVVTTNYDTLFERASEAGGEMKVAVLPYERAAGADRWVLKLHGCISQTDDIVLTRSDYLRYGSRRAALSGLVQALLITRHMLFVGFGLTDDNFHRIADAVRQALPSDTDQPLGTALMLESGALVEELWDPELRVVSVGGSDIAQAARRLEILLDWVLAHTEQSGAHILDRRYENVLSTEEKELRSVIGDLKVRMDGLSWDAKRTDAYRRLVKLLESFGSKV